MTGNTEYKNKWQAENRERINLVVPKGYKTLVKKAADFSEESLNGYIKKAIDSRLEIDEFIGNDETIERDQEEPATTASVEAIESEE